MTIVQTNPPSMAVLDLETELAVVISPAHSTYQRKDLVVRSSGELMVVNGWPSPHAVPPARPTLTKLLALVTVQAGVVCITNNDIRNFGARDAKGQGISDRTTED
jgi:hypothetical protein